MGPTSASPAAPLVQQTPITVLPLGAGQDVGRSCVLVKIGNKQVMFDCGMHMGYEDHRRFPNFSLIANPSPGSFEKVIDAVIITHFHLDHCGALPHFTEKCGYNGPIYMTHPTKAISPILLEDFRRIVVEKKGESDFFTTEDIWNCMKKVVTVNIHQTIKVDDELEIRAYYAGHVIGAAMFHIRVGHQSVVYTGDYNMTPDRHLGAAWIEPLRPDLLITESTYATTVRESKRARERDFLTKVHECVSRGGKVLIPCFALGRAQELCILIEQFWDRNNLSVPVYFSAGMTDKANHYYKLFINWTNDRIKKTFVRRNAFDFKYIRSFDRSYADLPGPMVLFATPGMLHAGTSLEVFKKWAPDPRNMLIMPGYCVAGTVGARVLAGQKEIEIDKKYIPVNLSVRNMSFSAHADAKGIMQLIHMAKPRKVMLVHGEKKKMAFLSWQIIKEFPGTDCFFPRNDVPIEIPPNNEFPVVLAKSVVDQAMYDPAIAEAEVASQHSLSVAASRPVVKVHGFVVRSTDAPFEPLRLISPAELGKLADRPLHEVTFRAVFRLPVHLDEEGALDSAETTGSAALEHLARRFFHRSRAFFLEQNILVRMVEEHGIHVGHTVRLRFLQHVPANEAARLSTVSEAVDGSPAPEDPLPAEDPNATICGLEVRWSFEDDDVVSAIAGRAVRWLAP